MFQFSLPNVDDTVVSLSDYKDQSGVIVIFSCNHCPYVIAYEERMKKLHDSFAPKGVPVIAISANDPIAYPQDSPENMKIRARDKNFPFPYLFDESQEVAKAYGAERTPHVFFLTPSNGSWELRYKGAIDDNWEKPNEVAHHFLQEQVQTFLDTGTVAFKETPAVGCTIKWRM